MIRIRRALLVTVLAVAPVLAAESNPPFALPPRIGAITDYHPGKKQPADQTIVLIQDLHANVGVQKNIASVLYRLRRENKVPWLLVCVEGASGEGDVSLLRSLPGPIRRGFEAFLLHKAYLTGAELAATEASADWEQQQAVIWNRIYSWFSRSPNAGPVSLSPIRLWGVDDPDLYRKNWHAAKMVDRQRNQALIYVRGTKSILQGGSAGALTKQLDLVTKLLLLQLQPKQYKEYLKGRALNPKGPPIYESTVKAAEEYYAMAELRSRAMAENVLAKMGRTPGYTAVVTGGFHTQEMAEEFKQKGYSYVVVTPRVEVLDQDEAYRARLREEE